MEIDYIGDIIAGAILFVITGVSAYILNYFRGRKQEIINNQSEIDKISDKLDDLDRKCKTDSLRLRKAVVILSKRLDKKNKEAHPDMDTAFEEITKDILTEDY
jgi:hypothetical protein